MSNKNLLKPSVIFHLSQKWLHVKLQEVCEINSGYGFPLTYQGKFTGDIPFYKVADISKAVLNGNLYLKQAGNYLSLEECKKLKATPFKKGTIVFAKIGEALKLNRRAILSQESLVDNNVMGIYPHAEVLHNMFAYYFFLTIKLENLSRATTVPSVRKSDVEQILIPLPPLNEQKRIVAKIEALFAGLEAGERALKIIKAQLKRYRQAVLKHAMEGKLTEEWRKENKIKESWKWSTVGDISKAIQYGTSEKASNDSSGISVLRMGNIQDGRLIFENLKYFPKGWKELKNFLLNDGDILFNRTNSAELVGKTAVYKRSHLPAVFASYLIRVKVNKNIYVPDMLSFFINSFFGRKYISSVVSQQVGQANVNGTKLSQMPIPLPPLAEQEEIVKEIERRFSVAEEVEKIVEQSLTQAERLRQSILKRAFEGKLVPQDVNDEPAEKLLAHIKAEKGKILAEKNTGSRGRKEKTSPKKRNVL